MYEKVVTRFAPSPTGNLNIGGVRAGIFAYLFARHNGGQFILRIEDTDKERSKKEYEDNIIDSLKWLGLEYDNFYRQSDNAARHEELLRKLIAEGKAYISKEEDGNGRVEVIRFKNPNKEITFTDTVHGKITFDTTELKDFVIAKSFIEPVFHFAVVVDDADEGVTHVIRGADHISNTPRQMLIREALGIPHPEYAHLPLIVSSDRSKLSKRKGAKALSEYRDLGFLPEAILNYDAFLGWHPEGEREIYSKKEMARKFTLERVQKSPAMFDEAKLLWFNAQHIKKLSDEEFSKRLAEYALGYGSTGEAKDEFDRRLVPLIKERAQTLSEAKELLREYDFLARVSVGTNMLLQNGKIEKQTASRHLQAATKLLEDVNDEDFTPEKIKNVIFPYATEHGRGEVLWPMRVALSGREKSPDPFTIASMLGKKETLKRIASAAEAL
ncbi:glutamate--tRNA ligase [Candidatus Adlerbacteria bacterium RIFCSPHIGHO2_01_FULL_54_23]|uniref:Glutamate--tRNA ligase n=3 Tax=Candidatus Adleribacteriota TaxID=1752736 RepID=A0A1F4Y121_9BACT|nr:MAG: Glutamate-tRNA ligase [Candidatus Adlerbacteria bacterium GW2011_GWA1_54_10]KKW37956.1 MAG: Glutamate-tRNA ligase [Candidatus Adlerbacteria bacterium GW2011_GWB1_54_7]OGC78564.1 MAG: glutamate--tRNA ligase [Candidatus Adlerbacteria bacterium RIFCSPHIGHO2_01_FULL_54_23]OGC87574.1 MAG: glutamate--tRNA ligase [Candidatus Adlerbacteria bacterium RIFCSPLOWO2_01_FULL_54_16]